MTSYMPDREIAKASAPKRRATHKAAPPSKPPPPCVNDPVPKPKPKPKASPTPEQRRVWAEIMNSDPDHASEGAGLGMRQPSSRVVVQGLVQDPDLPQNVVRGQPAQISPMTSMTTVDWESLSMDDPWTQEPREIHEF